MEGMKPKTINANEERCNSLMFLLVCVFPQIISHSVHVPNLSLMFIKQSEISDDSIHMKGRKYTVGTGLCCNVLWKDAHSNAEHSGGEEAQQSA